MADNPIFKVCKKRCDQCLFSKNRIVSEERMLELLQEIDQNQGHFICHKTEDVCCKGFFDTQGTLTVNLAKYLDIVEFVQSVCIKKGAMI